MPLLVDGNEVRAKVDRSKLGEDERQLLDALHGKGALGEQLKKDLEKNKDRAKYKIEVQFLKARSSQAHVPNLFNVQVWESGRRLHGGGDQRMVFCGYWPGQGYTGEEECGKPISDGNFGVNHLVCPHCRREMFLDENVKKAHIKLAMDEKQDVRGLRKMPIANPLLLGKLSPGPMSIFLAKIFRNLDSNADIYVKFHATDIRHQGITSLETDAAKVKQYEKARAARTERGENRGLLIYPLTNIIRDTLAGATLEGRLKALILA